MGASIFKKPFDRAQMNRLVDQKRTAGGKWSLLIHYVKNHPTCCDEVLENMGRVFADIPEDKQKSAFDDMADALKAANHPVSVLDAFKPPEVSTAGRDLFRRAMGL